MKCLPVNFGSLTEEEKYLFGIERFKVVTLCNFGEHNRRSIIGRHKQFTTAMRQYARVWNIYGRLHKWCVWQETVDLYLEKTFPTAIDRLKFSEWQQLMSLQRGKSTLDQDS
jgi:hypothetical protein